MAVVVLSAVAVLDVGSATAEAAPGASRFAGSYVGVDPRAVYGSWAVTISNGGRITSSFVGATHYEKMSMEGQVGADGSYSLTVTVTYLNPEYGPRDKRKWLRESYESAGNMTLDLDGNIISTPDTGGSFVWLRQ